MASRGLVTSRSLAAELVVLLLCLVFCCSEAIWLSIPTSGTKCVSEEIQSNVLVLADYYVVDEHNPHNLPTVASKVTSPFGNTLHHKENVSYSQFAFTTQETGNYLACFWIDSSQQKTTPITLGIEWKIGIAAKDWDTVAKKEKIEGVELQLRRLEGLVEAIHENLNYLKARESEMREVSEVTNSRVAWFSIMSLGVCVMVSVWQIWHLKRYFQKKKLI